MIARQSPELAEEQTAARSATFVSKLNVEGVLLPYRAVKDRLAATAILEDVRGADLGACKLFAPRLL